MTNLMWLNRNEGKKIFQMPHKMRGRIGSGPQALTLTPVLYMSDRVNLLVLITWGNVSAFTNVLNFPFERNWSWIEARRRFSLAQKMSDIDHKNALTTAAMAPNENLLVWLSACQGPTAGSRDLSWFFKNTFACHRKQPLYGGNMVSILKNLNATSTAAALRFSMCGQLENHCSDAVNATHVVCTWMRADEKSPSSQ